MESGAGNRESGKSTVPAFWAGVLCGALLLQSGGAFVPLWPCETGCRHSFFEIERSFWGFVKVWFWPVPVLALAIVLWVRARRRAGGKEALAGMVLVAFGLVGLFRFGPEHPVAAFVSGLSVLAVAAFGSAVLWESKERVRDGE